MSLEDRITRVEAELAIRNVIARYGMAADCGDIESALACHTEDAVYVVSNPNAGRGGVTGDLELKGHSRNFGYAELRDASILTPDCAHTVGPSSSKWTAIQRVSWVTRAFITIRNSCAWQLITGHCTKTAKLGKSPAAKAA